MDVNAYYWALITRLSEILHRGKIDLHKDYLKEYGECEYILVDKKATPIIESYVKYYEKLGERNGAVEYLVMLGSSEMNSKQFSRLLDGVLQDCENMGIRTYERERIEEMIEEMEGKNNG